MSKPEDRSSLKELDQRIRAVRQQQKDEWEAPARGRVDATGWAFGMRLTIDLISGIAVGVGLGWLLDRWLGTSPFLLILFFFLGSAAGILNVYRNATRQGLAVGYRKPEAGEEESKGKGSGNGA